jgi:hypothetical protein
MNDFLIFLLFLLLGFSAGMLFFINLTLNRILGTLEGHWGIGKWK